MRMTSRIVNLLINIINQLETSDLEWLMLFRERKTFKGNTHHALINRRSLLDECCIMKSATKEISSEKLPNKALVLNLLNNEISKQRELILIQENKQNKSWHTTLFKNIELGSDAVVFAGLGVIAIGGGAVALGHGATFIAAANTKGSVSYTHLTLPTIYSV